MHAKVLAFKPLPKPLPKPRQNSTKTFSVDCRVFAALPTKKIDFRPAKIAARFAATAIVHKIDRHDIDLCGPTLAVRGI
jgi:hypothetical protein